ncbi:hypothetical protein ACFPKZ_06070 [Streptosporangium amethystogenes subsp. fukuiense]
MGDRAGPSMTQVDYRLQEGAGCRSKPHIEASAEPSVEHRGDAQLAYRLADERGLMWIGEGLRDVGIVPGSTLRPADHEAARAIMDGVDPRSGEILVAAKKAVDPRAMLAGVPLLQALEKSAHDHGLRNVGALLVDNAKMAKRAARLERGVQRKGEAYVLAYEDARKLAKAAGLDLAAI